MANLDDARCEVPVSKRNRHFKTGVEDSFGGFITVTTAPQSHTGVMQMIRPETAVNNMESGDPSIVVRWRTTQFPSNIGSP
jgi:hypothetical protein